mgnify:CR=1 FL=1
MKNTIFTFILLSIFISSCKKENNRIGNATYQLDSVRIESLDANDSVSGTFTFPVSTSIIDTFFAQNNNQFGGTYYRNGDSINISQINDVLFSVPWLAEPNTMISVNKKPITFYNLYTNGSFAQEGYTKSVTKYYYDQTDKLDNIYTSFKSHPMNFGSDSDWYESQYVQLNYNGNNLVSANTNKHYSLDYHYLTTGYDSVSYPNNKFLDFYYINNYSNQKQLIGIDLNDLILDEITGIALGSNLINLTSGYSNRFVINLFMVNSLFTYNTNCTSLIEKYDLHFDYKFGTNIVEYRNSTQIKYTFDSSKNNRVSTMKFIRTIDNLRYASMYTFFYKD